MFDVGVVDEQTIIETLPASDTLSEPVWQLVYWTLNLEGLLLVTLYWYWTQGVGLGVGVGVGVNEGQGTSSKVV